jgi:hypothetical protein
MVARLVDGWVGSARRVVQLDHDTSRRRRLAPAYLLDVLLLYLPNALRERVGEARVIEF